MGDREAERGPQAWFRFAPDASADPPDQGLYGGQAYALAGLVLLNGVLHNIPGIGPSLDRFAGWLVPFEVALGVIAIIVGLLDLLSVIGVLLILAGLVLQYRALNDKRPEQERRIGPALQ